ncbi:mycofactocin-coupled SDR family oxidoreductase [Thermomonospora cellulosilytica]|uniref:SDR family mycofactocin-dependent oxidoreductase n=1 Tax=Thermomonospora cellulosilytica TaxID=1411118 RepID=A0A7W3N0J9_9ACTN|nr:mycofactocin-coupled SDR family oxidoreductase [Thermomonospora cellulosilytica]MBA9005322.1 SDR family mycofactocin-dependent oxidoreductase [Thermomonospora cellulosilytica]
MGRLTGKVAFITGAARGQGRAEAVRLAAEGADIIAIDLVDNPSPYVKYPPAAQADLDETAELVREQGRRVLARKADVRDLGELEAVVREGVSEFGRLDIVVANAGIVNYGRTWELTEEQWQDVIDVNLTGVWKTVRATVPILVEQGQGGSVILISSVAGLKGLPFLAHYAASKHGVVGLAKTLANELGEHDIRVNTIHPHGVRTGMTDGSMGDLLAGSPMLGPIYMPALPYQMVEPEDIANMVAFLASDEGKYITGSQMRVDLGALNR